MNILIIKWGALGDLIASTPAIRSVRESYPDARITLLTNKLMTQILPAGFIIDDHIIVNTHKNKVKDSLLRQIATILKLRRRKYDLALNLRWTSERAALITYLSGAIKRAGSGPERMKNVYTNFIPHPKGRYHEIHRNLDIVKAAGCKTIIDKPVVAITKEEEEFASRIFEDFFEKGKPVLCIHPGASRPVRAWLPERFAEIGKRFIKNYNGKVLLTWGKGEEELVQFVAEKIGNGAVISKATDTIGKLAAVIKKSTLFFSNCTGPMNVAVAAGTPVVALLASSDPLDWGAYGELHLNIKSPLVLDSYSDEDERRAMEALETDYVWELLSKRFEKITEERQNAG
ncbi:glycosyltransferase family 9 protein [Melioribacter sp. OK-6-Me]|uniref:glycosyltransferase family 9 protein n=1 Tax=unclassified Melioribacter TaxID=2627329 RepID=UPI003ED9D351